MIRDFVHTVKLDGALVPLAEPVRIQEALEGAVTSVAEIVLSGSAAGPLSTNTALTIDHVNRGAPTSDNRYTSRRQFAGIVNQIDSDGVTLTCTGPLAKLRRTRTDDTDLSGLTDITAARAILDFCGISYTAGDIGGWGYVLGQVSPIIWSAGQSGAAMLGELDRVFHCATIEVGDGRIVRFPYHLSPYQYTSPTYAKTFTRGQVGVSFYDDQRVRGDIDQIQNYWQVTGLSYQGAEGTETEGCSFQVYAVGQADHPQLGAGIFTGPQTFSSDLIQSEDLAKAIATWLLQAYNREPDALTIVCGNDALVGPGDLILVKDPSYGIDLSSQKRYLVRTITRDGDTMTLECIGGATGIVGSVQSGITRQCNDTSAEVGSNPPAFDAPAFSIPPDPSADFVDPVLDPIVPDGGDVPTPPNLTAPLIGCTQQPGAFGSDLGDWPDQSVAGDVPWRGATAPSWFTTVDPDHDFRTKTLSTVLTSGSLTFNQTAAPETKTADNDVQFGKNELVSVLINGTMHYAGSSVTLALRGPDSQGLIVTLYAEPGVIADGKTYGLVSTTENQAPGTPDPDPYSLTAGNGGYAGTPVAADTQFTLSVSFDPASEYQTIWVDSSAGGTVRVDNQVFPINGFVVHYDDCDHAYHKLTLSVQAPLFPDPPPDAEHPTFTFDAIAVSGGGDSCQLNPDYIAPARTPEET